MLHITLDTHKKFQNCISNNFIYHKKKLGYINLFPFDFIYHNRVFLTSDLDIYFRGHIINFFKLLALLKYGITLPLHANPKISLLGFHIT